MATEMCLDLESDNSWLFSEPRWSPVLGSRETKQNAMLERKAAFEGSNKWLSFFDRIANCFFSGTKISQNPIIFLFSCYTETNNL